MPQVAAGSRARLFGEGSTYATLLTDPGFTAAGVQVRAAAAPDMAQLPARLMT